jgi:hypothetical protein
MAVRKIFIAEISRTATYTYNRAHVYTHVPVYTNTGAGMDAGDERERRSRNWRERTCVRVVVCVPSLRTVFESTRPSCRIDDISICRFDDRSFHSRASRCRYHGQLGETRELRTLPRGAFK